MEHLKSKAQRSKITLGQEGPHSFSATYVFKGLDRKFIASTADDALESCIAIKSFLADHPDIRIKQDTDWAFFATHPKLGEIGRNNNAQQLIVDITADSSKIESKETPAPKEKAPRPAAAPKDKTSPVVSKEDSRLQVQMRMKGKDQQYRTLIAANNGCAAQTTVQTNAQFSMALGNQLVAIIMKGGTVKW